MRDRFDSAEFTGRLLFLVLVVIVMLGICAWAAGCAHDRQMTDEEGAAIARHLGGG